VVALILKLWPAYFMAGRLVAGRTFLTTLEICIWIEVFCTTFRRELLDGYFIYQNVPIEL